MNKLTNDRSTRRYLQATMTLDKHWKKKNNHRVMSRVTITKCCTSKIVSELIYAVAFAFSDAFAVEPHTAQQSSHKKARPTYNQKPSPINELFLRIIRQSWCSY